jgi:hypothetical protein
MAQMSATATADAFVSLFVSICCAAGALLKYDRVVVDVRPPVKIFGDIHGHLQDLLRLFLSHGFPINGSGGDIDIVTYNPCVHHLPQWLHNTRTNATHTQRQHLLCASNDAAAAATCSTAISSTVAHINSKFFCCCSLSKSSTPPVSCSCAAITRLSPSARCHRAYSTTRSSNTIFHEFAHHTTSGLRLC